MFYVVNWTLERRVLHANCCRVAAKEPQNTFYSTKRLIGRRISDVRRDAPKASFRFALRQQCMCPLGARLTSRNFVETPCTESVSTRCNFRILVVNLFKCQFLCDLLLQLAYAVDSNEGGGVMLQCGRSPTGACTCWLLLDCAPASTVMTPC